MKVLVDTSIWIDLYAGRVSLQTVALTSFVANNRELLVGDLVLTEVLQGTRDKREFARRLDELSAFEQVAIVDSTVAIEAARFYQQLRARGVTVRKTIDTLIATRCVVDDLPLLYADRDFDPFVEHCGLKSALDLAPGPH